MQNTSDGLAVVFPGFDIPASQPSVSIKRLVWGPIQHGVAPTRSRDGKILLMKNWKFWVGLLISAVLLYFALRGLDFGKMWEVLKTAQYIWLIPGIAVYFVAVWVRAWRWHYLLRPLKKIPTATMFPVVTIGYFGNNILPARAGEVLRAFVLRKREGVSGLGLPGNGHRGAHFRRRGHVGFRVHQPPGTGQADRGRRIHGRTLTFAIWRSSAPCVFVGALLVFLLAAMFPQSHRTHHHLVDRPRLCPSIARPKTPRPDPALLIRARIPAFPAGSADGLPDHHHYLAA